MFTYKFFKLYRLSLPLWAMGGALLAALVVTFLTQPVFTARADTNIYGPITGNTTWNIAGSPYVITNTVQVVSGATLTIEPGVTVKFNLGTSLRVDGALIATGCTFTSNAPTPARDDWGNIFFSTSSVDAVVDSNGNNYAGGSKIQNCLIEWGGDGVNGAIETSAASPFLDGNIIRNNGSSGIYGIGRSAGSPIVISRNDINNNDTDNTDGGGIYTSRGQVITNTVRNNVGADGGGIFASSSGVRGNTIEDNTADDAGGGIFATDGTIAENNVNNNLSNGNGGGIYAENSNMTGNTVGGNSSYYSGFWGGTRSGGGIYSEGSDIIDNIVSGNRSYAYAWPGGEIGYGKGGGIYSAGNNTISNNIVTGNEAEGEVGYGGGIYTEGGVVNNNLVGDNIADSLGDAYGGGVFAEGGTVINNTLSSNTATGDNTSYGGGVYGQINATIEQNTLSLNSASNGGGIYLDQAQAFDNTVFNNNGANNGGGIYARDASARRNTLTDNSAANGGGLYGVDGAEFSNNQVQDNEADLGGGLYIGSLEIVQSNTILRNTAQSNGGGIYADGGTVNHNYMAHNDVPFGGHGSGAYLVGATDFRYNNVLTNTAPGGSAGGISISGQPTVEYNNFYGNQPYEAEVVSTQVATAALNYWGPIACPAIAGEIYDGKILPGRGELVYAPSLYEPLPLFRLSGPSGLTLNVDNETMTLDWTAAPDILPIGCRQPGASAPDLGYRLYYSPSDFCKSPKGTGLPLGDSPIDLGQTTSFTMPVPTASYTFTITAYDYLGRESLIANQVPYFSNNVNHPPHEPTNPSPADGATNVPISHTLTWSGSDLNGDVVTYTIAFGSVNPPPIVATSHITSYTPPIISGTTNLLEGTKYYWMITATDGLSKSIGSLWTFTTTETVEIEPQYYIYLPVVLIRQNSLIMRSQASN